MTAVEPQDVARFAERLCTALPTAISETFGGASELPALDAGVLPLLVMDLGDGHHLHLELDAAIGRGEPQTLVIVLRPSDGQQLFGLEEVPDAELGNPEAQLRLLAEFTEGAEALATSLAGALASTGLIVTLRVSGASLEEAMASPVTAAAPLGVGDAIALAGTMLRPGGRPVPIVLAAGPELVRAFAGAGSAGGAVGPTAAERAANLAASIASRRTPTLDEPAVTPPSRASSQPAVPRSSGSTRPAPSATINAHPVSFGQLDPAPLPSRPERDVDLILDVTLNVRVELGSTRMTVEDVLALSLGSVVELDRLAGEPVDIVINDRLIARGEVVVVEENFGVRITEILTARHRAASLV